MKLKQLLILLVCLPSLLMAADAVPELPATSEADAALESIPLAPPSSAAQKLYSAAKNDLLQIRVLLKSGRTQASVGSGFLIGSSDLVVTNYHVMSQIALEPEVYVGEFVDTNGQRGDVELLAVDVLHDLAVVRVSRKGTGFFKVPELPAKLFALTQGQYLYSLGNPLDLGFAISEGSYNGIIGRAFYDQFMFTGPINSGMSGGPNITAEGKIAGVNVSKRLDGELVSFLVPARFVVELLNKVAAQAEQKKKTAKDFNAEVAQQLIAHQNVMVNKLLETPLTLKALGPYRVPVRESEQVRCWGRSNAKPEAPFEVDQMNCQMESAIYVSALMQTGNIAIRHTFTRSEKLDALRFSHLISNSFKNQVPAGNKDQRLTAASCTEDFVKNPSLPLRAVLCVRAYRKFSGLYDFALFTASTDQSRMSLQSRIDARGVSYENGMRLSRLFLNSISINKVSKP
ncbi:S1 family peptidase [Undibacterium parvum]|uniref:Serine protease n=1 Tax=Undibacterium parvum TaxID=401471 RepID=A0A3Q9BRC8_9BURK|nr:serine protease [Undibacterium parvum]AZP12257.1 serine protease [Undibacterium parvum]